MDYDAYDAILHHIFKQTQGDAWFKPAEENISTGVCVRVQPGIFRVFPYENPALEPFEVAIRALNPEVAVKMRSAAVHATLAKVGTDASSFTLDSKNRIQVLDTMADLAIAEKGQCAAFIRDERVLVVWSDKLDDIIASVLDLEGRLLKLAWKDRTGNSRPGSRGTSIREVSLRASGYSFNGIGAIGPVSSGPTPGTEKHPISRSSSAESTNEKDLEAAADSKKRSTRLFAPFYTGVAVALAIFFIANGINTIIQEWVQDRDYFHLILLSTTPLVFCISLFFALQLINSLSYIIGPVAQYYENSKFYSSSPLPRTSNHLPSHANLPHITIQMPVFRESLEMTIKPSVESLKKAMLTYARQGGTSSIFINDDGLQLLPEQDRMARIEFYAHHGIGWVARPPHSIETPRKGRFKKASNMNYCLSLSLKMEEILIEYQADPTKLPLPNSTTDGEGETNIVTIPRPGSTHRPTSMGNMSASIGMRTFLGDDGLEVGVEERALSKAIQVETAGKAWAAGGKWMRIGEVILLVDSDTQVPEDCFLDAAHELAAYPEVAIIQHESDVIQVAHHYFENAISYFTRRVNRCIGVACANGEVAPFVGHNAFLRWQAIQDAAFLDGDGVRRFWSESNVSEDFDLALRLLLKGYIVRWATYSNGGFKEGVSLTCDDELNRWQKYAFGCNELIFNPLYQWLFKGPITSQLHRFLWSRAPLHYKFSVMSYMFSYYGIAVAMFLSILNYTLLGFALPIDGYFLRSWEIWLACLVVFPGAGNIGISALEYRLGKTTLLGGLLENLKWIPFFFFFFGGLSLHLSGAILAHLFSYNMTWTATKKEVERSNFFKEVPKILKRFGVSWAICWMLAAGMVILSTNLVPESWQVTSVGWAVIFPLAVQVGCHVLFPIVLNPWLMIFSY